MKATELRIGNYVQLDEDICVVNSCHEYGTVRLTPINRHPLDWKYESFNLEQTPQLKPIKLTEDILLKCGFRINTFDGLPWYEKECLTLDFMFDFERHDASTNRVHHVHQLQNLYFALTGEELTFKSE